MALAHHGDLVVTRRRAGVIGYSGCLALRRRRWIGPTSLSAGQADSGHDVTYSGFDPLVKPAARVSRVFQNRVLEYEVGVNLLYPKIGENRSSGSEFREHNALLSAK